MKNIFLFFQTLVFLTFAVRNLCAMEPMDVDGKVTSEIRTSEIRRLYLCNRARLIEDRMPGKCIPLYLCKIITEYWIQQIQGWKLQSSFKINEESVYKEGIDRISGKVLALACMLYKNHPTMISGSSNFNIQIWDLEKGALHTVLEGHKKGVTAVAYVRSKNMLISGSRDHTIKLWQLDDTDIKKTRCIKTLTNHNNWIRSIAISPHETNFASGSDDCTVKLWSLPEASLLHSFAEHSGDVRTVAWNYDGTLLVSGSPDKTLCVYDVPKKYILRKFTLRESLWGLASMPITNHVAVIEKNETLSLRDIVTGETIKSLKSPKCPILDRAIMFSPLGTYLASMCNTGGRVSIWDVSTGFLLAQFPQNNGYEGLCFVSENVVVASGCKDGTVNVFSDCG